MSTKNHGEFLAHIDQYIHEKTCMIATEIKLNIRPTKQAIIELENDVLCDVKRDNY